MIAESFIAAPNLYLDLMTAVMLVVLALRLIWREHHLAAEIERLNQIISIMARENIDLIKRLGDPVP